MEEDEEQEEPLGNIYKLKTPITLGSEEITEIELHEPTAEKAAGLKYDLPTGDDIQSLPVDINKSIKLINACTICSPLIIKNMKISDVGLCYYQLLGLFFQD